MECLRSPLIVRPNLPTHLLPVLALQAVRVLKERKHVISWVAPFPIEHTETTEDGSSGKESPFQKLGHEEFQTLLLLLDITDISRLRIASSGRFRQRLVDLTTELRFSPYQGTFTPTLRLDASTPTFLALFPSLRVLKLHRLEFPPDSIGCYIESPFKSLPSTLTHLELDFTTTSSATPDHLLYGLNFGESFPRLEVCKLCADVVNWHWMLTLPPTLLALLVRRHFDSEEIYSFVSGNIKSPLYDESHELVLEAQTGCPFPSLLVLEFANEQYHDSPLLATLPPTVTWFSWMSPPDDNWIHFLETEKQRPLLREASQRSPEDRAVLRSLRLFAPAETDFDLPSHYPQQALSLTFSDDEEYPLLPSLTYLRSPNYILTGTDELSASIIDKGLKLHTLVLGSITLSSPEAAQVVTSLLATVKVLRIWNCTSNLLSLLPSGLETFEIEDADESHWYEDQIRLLPSTLTCLYMTAVNMEIGHLPLLPRSILDLRVNLVNDKGLGTRLITPEMRLDGLPYDSIGTQSHLLLGLPPNLLYLTIYYLMDFDSTVGLFLPRSLRKLSSDNFASCRIQTSITTSMAVEQGELQHIGIRQAETAKEARLQRAISFFPPGCICSLPFVDYTDSEIIPFVSGTIMELK